MANVNALGDAIGATPKGDIGALLAGTPTERGKASREQLPALLRGKSEAEADVRRREMNIQQEELAKTAEAEKQYGRTLRQIDYGITQLEKPREAFVAPTLSASDYAANAAMRLVTGLALGGIGKMSAIGQLKAIKAMQDAEDANQTERFEQAKREFDQADAQRRDFNQRLKERVERLREGLKSDRAAAMVEAKLIAAETRDGLLAAQIRSGELTKALDTAERMIAQSDALDKQLAQEQRAREEKMRQEEAQRIEKIRQEEAAQNLQRQRDAAAMERVMAQQQGQTERVAQKPAVSGPGGVPKLGTGERFDPATGKVEAVEGSDLYRRQSAAHSKQYDAANTAISKSSFALKKIDELLSDKNKEGFENLFGGATAYFTRLLPGKTANARTILESLESNMKSLGLDEMRQSGSIGQITVSEWKILQDQIAALSSAMETDEARRRIRGIAERFHTLIDNLTDSYDTQFKETPFYKNIPALSEVPGRQGRASAQPQAQPAAPAATPPAGGPSVDDILSKYGVKK